MQEFITYTYIIYLSLLENIISKQPATHIREEKLSEENLHKKQQYWQTDLSLRYPYFSSVLSIGNV